MSKRALVLLAFLVTPFSVMAQSLQDQINAVDAAVTEQQAGEAKEHKRQQANLAAQRAAREQRENKLRDMQVESMSLDLDAKRARVKRSNEFVDQELKRQAAETDVIQSEADANRNISSGIGENLKSHGRAAETKAKK